MLIDMIQRDLQLDPQYLLMLARTASHHYKGYVIPKASGGFRRILHPARELKAIQRWIHENILPSLPVHPAAGAYRPHQGLVNHVAQHAGARFLLRMDFTDFFPSLSVEDIRLHLCEHLECLPSGWSETDTDILTRFVCYKGQLTIGAVTSPSLSNTLCYHLDQRLQEQASRSGISYTRYADDLFFSARVPNRLSDMEQTVVETIEIIPYPKSLRINTAKTRHSSKKGRMAVTGLILTPDGKVSVGHRQKRRIRAQVHHWNDLTLSEKRSLAGYLAYCHAVEPSFVESLRRKYGPESIDGIMRFMSQGDRIGKESLDKCD